MAKVATNKILLIKVIVLSYKYNKRCKYEKDINFCDLS